jgi:general secretion pathway protein E
MHQLKTRGERLHLGWLLKELVRDGLLTQADATSIAAKQRSADEAQLHPLDIIAARQCSHAQTCESLSIVVLCQWLATKVELEFVVLDPLKINVPVVTAEMSFAYAQRYGILCIQVHPTELVVATSEPFDLSWIESLEQTSKKTVHPVLAKPQEIKKYSLEFYSLAKSVFGAGSAKTGVQMADFE